jgi:hypothetical protein
MCHLQRFALIIISAGAMAAETWTGVVSDRCGAAHLDASENSKRCVRMSVKHGAQPVFVSADKQVFQISNPEKVMAHLGDKVRINGSLSKQKIRIQQIEPASE